MSKATREELQAQLEEMARQKAELERQLREAEAASVSAEQTGDVLTGEGARKIAANTYIENQHIAADLDRTDPDSLRRAYLCHLCGQTGFLSLSGVDPKAADDVTDTRLELYAVYTALLTQRSRREDLAEESEPDLMGRGEPKLRPVSAVEMLNRERHLVVLGDPGSGKSTFVNFAALCLAGEILGDAQINAADLALLTAPLPPAEDERRREDDEPQPQPWDHGALLPVRIVLRDFAARGLPPPGQRAAADHLWDFVAAQLAAASLPEFAPFLKRSLLEEGGLILLDGLDEVPEAEERRVQLKDAVGAFSQVFGRCRILVTSRVYAYQKQAWKLPGFAETVLAPFSAAQIRNFVDRWYAHHAEKRRQDPDDAGGRAELLKRAIFASDRLRGFAERPLLLTLMASLHAWRGGNLPDRREELYSEAVDLLRDRWESQRVVRNADGGTEIIQPSLVEWLKVDDREAIQNLLNELAFEAHGAQPQLVGTADIPQNELVAGLIAISENPDVRPQRLIEYLSNRAGLLLPRGVGVYTFPHLTFQEYLAAWHLTNDEYPDKLAQLTRADPDRWREVVLLAGAKAARGTSSAVWSLVDQLCFRSPDDPEWCVEDEWGAHLAGQALIETASPAAIRRGHISPSNQKKVALVKAGLCHVLERSRLNAAERVAAGQTLARLGDPRQHVLDVEQMHFCRVPPGPFTMGQGRDQYTHNLAYGYWIGRFPVTNAHFRQFVADGGYATGAWWPEAQAAGFWRDGGFQGRYDNELRRAPLAFGAPFNFSNHPVVGVSWYEALAFCRWLTHKLHGEGLLPKGWSVRLPGEPEWEKATRGGYAIPPQPCVRAVEDGLSAPQVAVERNPDPARLYPWGAEIDKERANYRETEINTTSAVGCFAAGRSPHGVEELSGNVWEWCQNLHQDYPYDSEDGRENLAGGADSVRVLRGGSFANGDSDVRCAARYWYNPNDWYDNSGFRCVVSPSVL